jgi:hypothetical protein
MKIEIEFDNCDLGGLKFEKRLTHKEIHLICTARLGGASIYQEEVIIFRGDIIPYEKAISYINTVNENNKSETLFPELNITILPLSKFNLRDTFNDKIVMKLNLLACLEINELHVKCPEIIFAFDLQKDFNGELALETLKEILLYKDDFIYTKKIFCTSFIN